MSGDRHRPRRDRGFSLMEGMLATVLVGYAMASMDSLFMAARTRDALAQDRTQRMLANEVHLMAQLLPRDPSGATGATSFADVQALDSLIGASFSPPIMANGAPYAELTDWTQLVNVEVCSLEDPSVATADDPRTTLAAGAPNLYRVSVTIRQGSQTLDTFTRLIRP